MPAVLLCVTCSITFALPRLASDLDAVLAPGSVLPPGRRIPSGQLWAGSPAKYVRDLTKDEVNQLTRSSWHAGLL